MREPPPHLTDEDVLATVNEHWARRPIGSATCRSGSARYHWRASGADTILFVTFDRSASGTRRRFARRGVRRSRRRCRTSGLDFVLAPLATDDGAGTRCRSRTAPSARRRGGTAPPPATAPCPAARALADHGDALDRLHATSPPGETPPLAPLVEPDLADDLAKRTASAWDSGPYGEDARTAIRDQLDHIATLDRRLPPARRHHRPPHLGPDPRRAAHPQPAAHRRRRCCSSTGSR